MARRVSFVCCVFVSSSYAGCFERITYSIRVGPATTAASIPYSKRHTTPQAPVTVRHSFRTNVDPLRPTHAVQYNGYIGVTLLWSVTSFLQSHQETWPNSCPPAHWVRGGQSFALEYFNSASRVMKREGRYFLVGRSSGWIFQVGESCMIKKLTCL